MKKNDRLLGLLGLAARSGSVVSGDFSAEKAARSGKAELVIVSCDASDNTKKKYDDICRSHRIPCLICSDKEQLGRAIGKDFRAVCCVTDANLAKAIIHLIEESE